jgi:lipopolysaccharide biosynthesis protein
MSLNQPSISRIAFYTFSDKKGIVRQDAIYYLEGLKTIASKIVVLVHGELSLAGQASFDALGVNTHKQAGLLPEAEEISAYDEVIITNNTSYGPIYPFQDMFDAMSQVACDFWSITAPPQDDKNFKSIWSVFDFTVFRKNIFLSEAWQQQPTNFMQVLQDAGYCYTSYCKNSADYSDMMIDAPNQLIIDQKCPVLKKDIFSVEYGRLLAYSRGYASKKAFNYIKQHQLYDVNLMLDDLLATHHYEYIKNALHLNYFLPSDNITHPAPFRPKTALFFHVYYDDLLSCCFSYMQAMPNDADIYITTSKCELLPKIKELCTTYHLERAVIKLVSARGRSESAFLMTCQDVIYQYDYVCIAHDKRSSTVKPGSIGLEFGYHNLDSLLKTKQYVENIIGAFKKDSRLGLLVPIFLVFSIFQRANGAEWGPNYKQVEQLMHELNLDVPIDPAVPPLMPAGGMFWCRPSILKKLVDQQWTYEDFPDEPLPSDGTLLHAIERIIPFLAQDAGYLAGWVSTVEDAEAHLTNISYRYRQARISERTIKFINTNVKIVEITLRKKLNPHVLTFAKKVKHFFLS